MIESISVALNQDGIQPDYDFVNQDTIRDNFSSITLLIDSIFDGCGGPGGAFANLIVSGK